MPTKSLPSFELARLYYQRGSFQISLKEALVAAEQAKAATDLIGWTHCARLIFQCSFELEKLDEVEFFYSELLKLQISVNHQAMLLCKIEHLLGMWSLAKGQPTEAESLLKRSLENTTLCKDYETMARVLHALAFVKTLNLDFEIALNLLEKALILTKELTLAEIETSCLILKGYIYSQSKTFDQGVELTWQAYENAKKSEHHHLIANILIQLALIYRDQGKTVFSEIFYAMAARGLEKEKFPRLVRMIEQEFQTSSKLIEYDLVIEENKLNIKARNKGSIDFKNQHVLFDLIKLLSKSPGTRFSKEDLIKKIWNQEYNPAVHDNTIYVNVKRLRTLLEPDPQLPQYILRDRLGYFIPSTTMVKIQNEEYL